MKIRMATCLAASMTGLALLASPVLAQGQTVPAEDFSRLEAGGGVEVYVTVGEELSVRMEGDEDDFDRVRFDFGGDELDISTRRSGWFRSSHLDVEVHITVPHLDAISFGRGVSARVDGIEAEDFDLNVSTGAAVRVSGTCDHLTAGFSTGASTHAEGLVCQTAEIRASTGASASLWAEEEGAASASTGASIRVRGNPTPQRISSSMGASVNVTG